MCHHYYQGIAASRSYRTEGDTLYVYTLLIFILENASPTKLLAFLHETLHSFDCSVS